MSAEMWSGRKYLTDEIFLTTRLIEQMKKRDGLIVDVGANIGVFSLAIASKFKSFRYLAIEPHPRIFDFLKRNIKRNKLAIRPLNLAIGSENCDVGITTKHADDMNQVFKIQVLQKNSIEMTTLDSLINENIEILKIDVEGMEKKVLDGAELVLRKTNNVIIEVDSENYKQYGYEVHEVLAQLSNAGFELVGIHRSLAGKIKLTYPLNLSNARGENVLATRMQSDQVTEFINRVCQ